MIRQAVVLAGGRGTRLGPLTDDTPKPLLDVGGRPFLGFLLRDLSFKGVERVLLTVGYRWERIGEYLQGVELGLDVELFVEEAPLGTGGALWELRDRLDPQFLVTNGDSIFDVPLQDVGQRLLDRDVLGAVALRHVDDVSRFGSVHLERERILAFSEKGESGPGLINGGIYALRRECLGPIPGAMSLEKDLLPELAARGTLAGSAYERFFIDIGVPQSFAVAQEVVPRWYRKPIAFLDRDGVLNVDRNHAHLPEHILWMPEAREAVRWLNDAGYRVVVVTNQAGIAKGFYTEDAFRSVMRWMEDELAAFGANLDAVYFCPHHPRGIVEEYTRECDCRKPGPAMILRALSELEGDPGKSFLVGDKTTDLDAAAAAGIRSALYDGSTSLLSFVRRQAETAPSIL